MSALNKFSYNPIFSSVPIGYVYISNFMKRYGFRLGLYMNRGRSSRFGPHTQFIIFVRVEDPKVERIKLNLKRSWASCSKLTMSLVNISFKFQT